MLLYAIKEKQKGKNYNVSHTQFFITLLIIIIKHVFLIIIINIVDSFNQYMQLKTPYVQFVYYKAC